MRRPVAKPTEEGAQAFVKMLKNRLTDKALNQLDLCNDLGANGMGRVNQDVISKLVGGRLARLNFFMVCSIARTIEFPHPARPGDVYSLSDLYEICCSLRDAVTGEELPPDQVRLRSAPNPFVAWLTGHLADRGVGEAEFLLHVQQETNIKGLDLRAVLRGDRLPTNSELHQFTGVFDHDDGRMYTFAELEAIRDRKPGLPVSAAPTTKAPTNKRQGQKVSGRRTNPRSIATRG